MVREEKCWMWNGLSVNVGACYFPSQIVAHLILDPSFSLFSVRLQPLPQHGHFHPLRSAELQWQQSGRGTQSQFLPGGHGVPGGWVWSETRHNVCFHLSSRWEESYIVKYVTDGRLLNVFSFQLVTCHRKASYATFTWQEHGIQFNSQI